MALTSARSILIVGLVLVLFTALVPIGNVHALSQGEETELPSIDTFVSQVSNGQAGELRGIYIPAQLAALVVHQPAGDPDFVSPRQNVVTQFNLASQFGATGLLAHNYLAGENLAALQHDQIFYLVYGDGRVAAFLIKEILRYQALEPESSYSQFVDLANNDILTATELFTRVYDSPGKVILQTCIAREKNLSWGRLFIIAEPLAGISSS
jgi:hypothetical protein